MNYVLIKDNNVSKYPYNLGMLRKDNPNVSFPKNPAKELLENWGVYEVTFDATPTIDVATQKVSRAEEPVLIDGVWRIQNTIVEKTDEEKQEYSDAIANNVRAQRNDLLKETDWTQVADAPVDQTAWATYRQALRDITTQDGFPLTVTWPTQP